MENANRELNEVMLEDMEPTIKDCVGSLRNKWKVSWDLAEDVANKVRAKIRLEGEKITKQPKAYVKKVFTNAGADFFRSKKARGLDEARGVASPSRTPDDSIEECKAQAWYKALTPSQKEIADLFLEGWDRDQVREQLGISRDAFRQRIQAMKKKIAPFLREAW
jgi:DNA-directed RNA polymerase specialized sigma24 family protein